MMLLVVFAYYRRTYTDKIYRNNEYGLSDDRIKLMKRSWKTPPRRC